MTMKTARSAQYSNLDPVLLLALELGGAEWKLGFSTGLGQKPRHRSMPAGDLGRLETEIRAAKRRFGLAASTRVVSCYEAGRDGFWLHRFLAAQGIENLVVDSSSIEVSRRSRRAKTDRLDGESLLDLLLRHLNGPLSCYVRFDESYGC